MIKDLTNLFHTHITPILQTRKAATLVSLLFLLGLFNHSYAQQSKIDSLWEEFHNQADINSKTLLLAKIGFSLRTINIDSAFLVLEKGFGLARETGFIFGEAECILNTGSVYFVQSDFDKAQQAYQRALGIYESIDSSRGVAKSMNNLGLIYYQKGNYEKANTYFEESLKYYDDLVDQPQVAGSLHNIAMVYAAQGDYPKALDTYLKSLKIVEELHSKQGIAYTCISLGGLYQTIEDDEKAIEYYEKGLKLSEELLDNIGMITCLYNIGTYKEKHKDYDAALTSYEKSLSLAQNISNEQYAAICLRAIGNVNKELKRFPEAKGFFERSLAMQDEMGDEPGMSETNLLFGELYTEMGEPLKGIKLIKNAIDIANKYGNQEDLMAATKSLAEVYEAEGRLDKALTYYNQSEALRASLFGKEPSAEIAKIQLKYNSEIIAKDFQLSLVEKEKTYQELKYLNQKRTFKGVAVALFIIISLSLALWYLSQGRKKANIALNENNEALDRSTRNLESTHAELSKANHQLNVANASLQQFAFVASNDLMEALGAVSKYSQLLRTGMETNQPDEMINYYLEIIARNGRQMYKTLDDLLNYVNLRVNPSAKMDVDLLEIVRLIDRGLEQEIDSSGGQFIYHDLPHLQAQLHLIRQLFFQLIKNSVQFKSHDDLMLIEVGVEQQDGNFIFSVKDNGIGIAEEYLDTIFEPFSRVSKEERKGSGLGLALCKKIVELYRGKIWIESAPGVGTSVYFTLPDCDPTFVSRKEDKALAQIN